MAILLLAVSFAILLGGAEPMVIRFAGFIATMGVALAAATVGFYAAKEIGLHRKGLI